jgi:hypothetical protein
MPAFIFTYRKAAGYTRTPQTLAAWQAWFGGIGGQLTDTGKPVVAHTVLGTCDPNRTEPGGYSVIQADDLEAATAIAKGCPHLERGGGVEVGELGEVPSSTPAGG